MANQHLVAVVEVKVVALSFAAELAVELETFDVELLARVVHSAAC